MQIDVTVIGGGMAGICAAIAAAREGAKTALINDRPVLGGNASSEIRVWVSGADHGCMRFARETGIIEELRLANMARNPEGNPYIWDLILLETVMAEPNLSLFLNTHIFKVETAENTIISVSGVQLGTEKQLTFQSPIFIDATGDGSIGFLAGAAWRMGREGRDEFGESLAPLEPDQKTLGHTILFATKDVGYKVEYTPPFFAKKLDEMAKIHRQRDRTFSAEKTGCDYWWIEYGGILDTIKDNEEIRFELQRLVYGAWDFIKNSGNFPEAETLTLEWVGSIPGKRESRRLIGDYILNQRDLMEQRIFSDAVCHGGWSIDTHPPEGIYTEKEPSTKKHVGVYSIPYRSLYSRNIENLFMAGRNISATHIAFASTRVMATCALMGQAVGTAAALCLEKNLLPRELGQKAIGELQDRLIKQDVFIVGKKKEEPDDLVPKSNIRGSSVAKIENIRPNSWLELTESTYFMFPVTEKEASISLLFQNNGEQETLEIKYWQAERPENYEPGFLIGKERVTIPAGESWKGLSLSNLKKGMVFLELPESSKIRLGTNLWKLTGIATLRRRIPDEKWLKPLSENLCFKLSPQVGLYDPSNVGNGYLRPFGLPHLWASDLTEDEEYLEFEFDKLQRLNSIKIHFNSELDSRIINLRAAECKAFPTMISEYGIQIFENDIWQEVVTISGNYQRVREHPLKDITTSKVRLVFRNTWGSPRYEVFAVEIK